MNKADLIKLFDVVGEDKRVFVLDALDEYLYFQSQINELRKLPLIRVSEKNPAKQETTQAGKLIMDCSNKIDAKRNTILRELNRVGSTAADELREMLAEFE